MQLGVSKTKNTQAEHGDSPKNSGREGHHRELITCDVNLSQLQNYMSNIIQVVNQHAKLLDSVGQELTKVPRRHEIGEMFDVLSHTFPFD